MARSTRLLVIVTVWWAATAGCGDDGHTIPDGGATDTSCRPIEIAPDFHVCLQRTPAGDPTRKIIDDGSARYAPLPPSVDHYNAYLRGCLTTHDQQNTGWCAANSTTAAMEALHCSPAGKRKSTRISEAHLWWLLHGQTDFANVSDGATITDAMDTAIAPANFLLDANLWPEKASTWANPDTAAMRLVADKANTAYMNMTRPAATVLSLDGIHGTTRRVPLTTLYDIKSAIANGYEVVVAMPIIRGSGFFTPDDQPGAGEIFDPDTQFVGTSCDCGLPACAKVDPFCNEGNHATVLVGYDDATQKFLLLNSWGQRGLDLDGDTVRDGYYHVTYGYVLRYFYDAQRFDQTRDRPPRLAQISDANGTICGIGTNGISYCWGDGQFAYDRMVPADPSLDLHELTGNGASLGQQACLYQPQSGTITANSYPWTGSTRWLCARSPNPIPASSNLVSIASGHSHACGLSKDGDAFCWGENADGSLGIGIISPSGQLNGTFNTGVLSPALVVGNRKFASIYASVFTTCGLDATGAASCWGYNNAGQLGTQPVDSNVVTAPVDAATGYTFTSLALGPNRTCGLTATNDVYCWGLNPTGPICTSALGQNCTANPIAYAPTDKYRQVVINDTRTVLLTTSGVVMNSYALTTAPTPVAGLPAIPFVKLSTSIGDAMCAIDNTGGVWCWGSASLGSVGNGSFLDPGPSLVPLPGPAKALTNGRSSCALVDSGQVYCWGDNLWGTLGTETPACPQYDPMNASWLYYTALQCSNTPVPVGSL
jgi:hypothetical protein